MYSLSESSMLKLKTCDQRLQKIILLAIGVVDFSVLCGHRNSEDQTKGFEDGKSKLVWPESPHNQIPSRAIDITPYPIDWSNSTKNLGRYYYLAGVVKSIAMRLDIQIVWGGDWDSDNDFSDQRFNDLVHFELGPNEDV